MTKTNKILFSALALMLSAVSGVFAVPLSPARSGNTTTVLPNGNILITGGNLGNGTPVATAVIYISSKAAYENLGNMNIAREEHTATLLPDGRVFIFGGRTSSSNTTNSYTIFDPATNRFVGSGTVATARAGHSATLITTGVNKNRVMVCGGYRLPAGNGINDCYLITINGNTVTSNSTDIRYMLGGTSVGHRRDFTATMLSNGNIFISGGRKKKNPTVEEQESNYVQANVSYDTENDTFGTESALVIGRRDHAAVTMNDGRVAIIGGFNENYFPLKYDVDSDDDWYNKPDGASEAERQNPGYHGFIDTVELFDKFGKPTIISGAESGIKTLPYRLAKTSSILSPGGRIYLYGGRGNIPVTFADIAVEFSKNADGTADSVLVTNGGVSENGDKRSKVINETNSHLYFNLEKTTLSRPVSGRIIDGDIFIPTADEDNIGIKVGGEGSGGIEVNFNGTSRQGYPKKDIRAPLDGREVGRQYDIELLSGNIAANGLKFNDIGGTITFYPIVATGLDPDSKYIYSASGTSYHKCSGNSSGYLSVFSVNPGNTTNLSCTNTIPASQERYVRLAYVGLTLTIEDIPAIYKDSVISGTITINGFTIERAENNNDEEHDPITINGVTENSTASRYFTDVTPTCSTTGEDESCTLKLSDMLFSPNLNNGLVGKISNESETAIGVSTFTATLRNSVVSNVDVKIVLSADKVTLTGESYNVGTSTIVIRDMLFSNNLSYDPSMANWDYATSKHASDTLYEFTAAKRDGEATALIEENMLITASGAPMIIGGRRCDTDSDHCRRQNIDNTFITNGPLYDRSDEYSLFEPSSADMLPVKRTYPYGKGAGGELNSPRQGHTATVLPNKKILVCGGSNGAQTLDSCELYNPETGTWTITGSMRTPRAGHTATLLPNGKVILTGGTDGTNLLNSSEVYNPKHEKFDDTVTYMHKTRQNHTATILPNGNVFVAGGSKEAGYELFITTEAKWITAYSSAPSLTHHTATLLKNGKVAIIGGLGEEGSPVNSVYICDPVHYPHHPEAESCQEVGAIGSNWSFYPPSAAMPRVYMHTAVLDKNGSIWVIGGSNGNYPKGEIYKLTPDRRPIEGDVLNFRYVGSLAEGLTGHTSNIGPDNIITIYGGKTPSSAIGYVSYINPDLESISITAGEPLYKRANHATVLDSEGYYMVIGGDDGRGVNYMSVDRNYFTELPDAYIKTDFEPVRQPEITNDYSENARPGEPLTLLSTNTSHNFHGYTEAGDGSAVYHNTPRVVLQAMDNFSGFLVDISTNFYVPEINNRDWNMMMSSMTAQLPGMVHDGDGTVDPELPWGYYYAIESVNGQFSNFKPVQVGENWEIPVVSTPVAPLDKLYCPHYPYSPGDPHDDPELCYQHELSSTTLYSVYESSIVWKWNPLPDLDGANKYINGYEIYSATTSETGPSLGRVPIDRNDTEAIPVFVSSGLPPNFPARIKVAAFNIWSESEQFALSDTFYTLASSASLNISVTEFQRVKLDWTSRNYEGTCYQLDWCKSNDVTKDCFLFENSANVISSGTFSETSFDAGSCYSSSSYTATNLTPATGYWFRVRAINGTNPVDWPDNKHSSGFRTEYSNHQSTITVSSMKEITGLATSSSILWTWNKLEEDSGISSSVTYEIFEVDVASPNVVTFIQNISPDEQQQNTNIVSFNMTSTVGPGGSLTPNTGYMIRVRPRLDVDINGSTQTYYGNYMDSNVVYTLANKPETLELSNMKGGDPLKNSLYVTWQRNSNSLDTIYNLVVSTSSDFSSVAFSTNTRILNESGAQVDAEGLIPNTCYYGRVSALNTKNNESEYAYFIDDGGEKAVECTYANLPSNLKITANSMSGLTIDWEHNGNPQVFDANGVQTGTRYEVSISTDPNFPLSPLPPYPTRTVSTVATSQTFSGLLTHTRYFIQIDAFNQNNDKTIANSETKIDTFTVSGPGNIDGSVGGTSNPSRDVEISGSFLGQRYVSLFVPAAAYDRETALAIAPYEYRDNRGAGALIPEHWDADFCNQQAVDPAFPVITAKIFTENPNPKVPVDFSIGYFDPEEATVIEDYKDEILLARYNKKTNSCLPLKTVFNQSSKIITASVNTFDSETALPDGSTVIQVIRRAAPSNMNEVKVYPNPMYVSRGDGYVTIEPVPAHTKLTLYTLSGAKIWEGSSDNSFVIVWKGENKYGNPVASGVYLGVLDSPAGKKKIKIAVEK